MAEFSEILNSNPWIGALIILVITWCIFFVPRINYCEHEIKELKNENKELSEKINKLENKENK